MKLSLDSEMKDQNMLEYKGYHAVIAFDPEDNILVGSVLGIDDSVTFHGSSVSEITEKFHDSVDYYLEICEAEGRTPDKVLQLREKLLSIEEERKNGAKDFDIDEVIADMKEVVRISRVRK